MILRVYEVNAARHDDLVGDDAVTFGISIYRNSWSQLEQAAQAAGWKTSRPDGSLVISGQGYRSHVYRWGQDEHTDLEAFRLDEAASITKRLIAERNGQLSLDYEAARTKAPEPTDLRDLVVVHAGNPDDGCCGIWIGAPVPSEEIITSPWAWLEPLWVIERTSDSSPDAEDNEAVPHDRLPEPSIEITPIEDESAKEA